MADVQENAQVPAQAETPAVEQPTIGLQDLQNAIKVIDFACEQGAFKGWAVIEQVAAVRGKLAAFVAAATPPEEKKEEVAPAAEAKPAKAKAVKAPKATAAKNVTKAPVKAKK